MARRKLPLKPPRKPRVGRRQRPVGFHVRNIDRELWLAVKRRAAEEGRSLRWVILELLFRYANYEIDFSS